MQFCRPSNKNIIYSNRSKKKERDEAGKLEPDRHWDIAEYNGDVGFGHDISSYLFDVRAADFILSLVTLLRVMFAPVYEDEGGRLADASLKDRGLRRKMEEKSARRERA